MTILAPIFSILIVVATSKCFLLYVNTHLLLSCLCNLFCLLNGSQGRNLKRLLLLKERPSTHLEEMFDNRHTKVKIKKQYDSSKVPQILNIIFKNNVIVEIKDEKFKFNK